MNTFSEYGEGEDEEGGNSDGTSSCHMLHEGEVDEVTVMALTICICHCGCHCRHVVIACGGWVKWVVGDDDTRAGCRHRRRWGEVSSPPHVEGQGEVRQG